MNTSFAFTGAALALAGLCSCTSEPAVVSGEPFDGPDYEREARLAEAVGEMLWEGEIVMLHTPAESEDGASVEPDSGGGEQPAAGEAGAAGAGGRKFLAVHSEALDEGRGDVALLLPGRGHHPLREYPNNVVRVGLAESGIASLAIQAPVLEAGRPFNDYLPMLPLIRARISSALDWLDSNYPDSRHHIVAHSCGVHMVMDWIKHHDESRIDSLTGLAMHNFVPNQEPPFPYPIAQMSTPIFDVMSERSSEAVLMRAWKRRAQARAGDAPYQQVIIEGASAVFEGNDLMLVNSIAGFIEEID